MTATTSSSLVFSGEVDFAAMMSTNNSVYKNYVYWKCKCSAGYVWNVARRRCFNKLVNATYWNDLMHIFVILCLDIIIHYCLYLTWWWNRHKICFLVGYQTFLITLICLLMKESESRDKNGIKNSWRWFITILKLRLSYSISKN